MSKRKKSHSKKRPPVKGSGSKKQPAPAPLKKAAVHKRRSLWVAGGAAALLGLLCLTLWLVPRGSAPAAAPPVLPTGTETAALLENAKQQNADTVAWLSVPGAGIDGAVMQAADNAYYQTRNEQGAQDATGCYFADYYSLLTGREALSQNTVIYGWAQEYAPEGARFSRLAACTDAALADQSPYIRLTLPGETLTFQIFALFWPGSDFYYANPSPAGSAWQPFIQEVRQLNQWQGPELSVEEGDRLLTLASFGPADPPLVVMAKLLAEEAPLPTAQAATPAPTETPAPTGTPEPANTPQPTPTPTAAAITPAPSATPRPAASPSPVPAAKPGALTEQEFWQRVETLVADAPKASLVKIDAGSFEAMPKAVLGALFGRDVNLLVVQQGQNDLIINGINMYRYTKKERYPLSDLRAAYQGFVLENSVAPTEKPGFDLTP